MEKISEWLDSLIEDIVNPERKLSDTLLKVKILAFKIEHKKLELWVNNELNGYKGKEKPFYRIVPTEVRGNLIQNAGFQGIFEKKSRMPIEELDTDVQKLINTVELDMNISELEKMSGSSKGTYMINLPHRISWEFDQIISNWKVDRVWQIITINSIEGVLAKIKSNLLDFLLELNKEYGNNDNISVMKKKADKIFDQTIGNINGENISISFNGESSVGVSHGDNSIVNSKNSNIEINSEQKLKVENFLDLLGSKLDDLGLDQNEKEDIGNEIIRVQTQIKRDSPKPSIINNALSTIHGVLTGVAANQVTPIVLEKLNQLIANFT